MKDWFDTLNGLSAEVSRRVKSEGFDIAFGGADPRQDAIKTPQPARSEFLQNRAMGDWAEELLAAAFREQSFGVTHYGASDEIDSADPAFAEFFREQTLYVRNNGKRPDLLIGLSPQNWPERIGQMTADKRDAYIAQASACIEVRSSKYKALKYMQVKAERKAAKAKSVGQMTPNFTVKIEDLVILYRWLEQHRLPQFYIQIFFDSAFAISVLQIFELIAGWPKGLTFVKPKKSQDKPTIFIPISFGKQVGTMVTAPTFSAETRESALGQVEAFVVPSGGKLTLDREVLLRVLGA